MVDAVVVGAGFAGMYQALRLRERGFGVQGFEAGEDVGGTWYWNRYPGARCDVESLQYCYSFEPWRWSERYATQPEILRYAQHVAERHDLRRSFRFGSRVTGLRWDGGQWLVEADDGTVTEATWCVLATGCLSVPKLPEVEGLDAFRGEWYHTGAWPHGGVDFTGKRAALIGTGSSGIQSLPVIAGQASEVWVLQRTPNFSVPARNRPLGQQDWLSADEIRAAALTTSTGLVGTQSRGAALDLDEAGREAVWEEAWAGGGLLFDLQFSDTVVDEQANDLAAEFVRRKIRAIVHDPAVAEALSPRSYPIGTKRLCVDSGYYETFNLPGVRLVTDPLVRVTERGIRTTTGEIVVDTIVCATGFDAMTGAATRIDVVGEDGRSLRDVWADGPATYLGLAVAGFPNLWLVTGPGSPSVLTNMLVSIEQHVDWIADCMAASRDGGVRSIVARPDAQQAWTAHVDEVAAGTLFPRAASWYMGANVPGKPRRFMPYLGGLPHYRERCDAVAAAGYQGFELRQ